MPSQKPSIKSPKARNHGPRTSIDGSSIPPPRVFRSLHVVRLRFKEKWDDAFKAFIFSTMSFRKQVYKLADGSGQRYVISQDDFRSIEVSYPSLDEQRQIGALLHTAENEITALESDLSRLRQEKKALMQQLLTGKRRVRVN